jgi:hypothetical protein
VAFGDNFMRRRKERIFARIIAALRFRILSSVRAPIVTEREFIALTGNHGHFAEKLRKLGQPEAAIDIRRNALYVGMCWLRLGKEHLDDADVALSANRVRSVFSRSYYATYNASKAVRYIVVGAVSLKGDDHSKASDLPDDFPNAEK